MLEKISRASCCLSSVFFISLSFLVFQVKKVDMIFSQSIKFVSEAFCFNQSVMLLLLWGCL